MAKQANAPVSPWRFRVVIAGLLVLAALLLARALTLQVLDVDRDSRRRRRRAQAVSEGFVRRGTGTERRDPHVPATRDAPLGGGVVRAARTSRQCAQRG